MLFNYINSLTIIVLTTRKYESFKHVNVTKFVCPCRVRKFVKKNQSKPEI
jgi:hypothetical protein